MNHPEWYPPWRRLATGLPGGQWMPVFGGATYPADNSSVVTHDDLRAYDVRRNEWAQLRPENPGPSGRVRPAMWQVGDRSCALARPGSVRREHCVEGAARVNAANASAAK